MLRTGVHRFNFTATLVVAAFHEIQHCRRNKTGRIDFSAAFFPGTARVSVGPIVIDKRNWNLVGICGTRWTTAARLSHNIRDNWAFSLPRLQTRGRMRRVQIKEFAYKERAAFFRSDAVHKLPAVIRASVRCLVSYPNSWLTHVILRTGAHAFQSSSI